MRVQAALGNKAETIAVGMSQLKFVNPLLRPLPRTVEWFPKAAMPGSRRDSPWCRPASLGSVSAWTPLSNFCLLVGEYMETQFSFWYWWFAFWYGLYRPNQNQFCRPQGRIKCLRKSKVQERQMLGVWNYRFVQGVGKLLGKAPVSASISVQSGGVA